MEPSLQDWMSALPEQLWDVPLTDLAIPGSHDAMSYCLDINSPLVRSESDFFRLLDGLFYCLTRPVIFKWATTQDKTIEEQLSMGIRFFDLRVAHKPNDPSSDLYFTHVIYTHLMVLETLVSVANWLKSHPKEIVILACSHFEGMDDRCHEGFIFWLKKLFGSKLCPRKESVVSLRSLWASGYQVILSYDCQLTARHQELWPAIPYWWANKHTAQDLVTFLEWNKDLGRPEGFFVCGLNLTADRRYITKNPKESLRTLTYRNWDAVTRWLEQQASGSDPGSLNIIAGDFVGPLPLCSLVIALNYKLQRKSSKEMRKQFQM
ncbi:PI-PLC X domain-containing protein 1 [Cololabis saira]|uniref:PI-PLC X domain-containing protein 1 n=1 Tax=Cololabis saira TaxID=129043 RepID=UPI002AD4B79A|nr:PI-PLC X domain-containing protein 1 [Cololabis saira]XP_061593864.1 PI-PLC X domain-containing protein 1 [Cololabis saira]